MKAGHNEAERPCSYLQSIWGVVGERGEKSKKKKKSGRDSEGDARLCRVTEMAADGRAFEMEIKRVI